MVEDNEEVMEYVEDTELDKYITFKVNNEFFGLELKVVQEIIGIQAITAIPETEDYIKGLINLRGKIIPVIDVRIRFRQEPFEYTDRTCIIIISVKGTVVGLIVETIAEVVSIPQASIIPPPSLGQGMSKNKYVYGLGKVGESVKMLLDPEKLIRDDEIVMLEQAVNEVEMTDLKGGEE